MLHSMTKDADLRYPRIVLYGDKKIHRKMKEVLARRGKSVSDWYREKQREFLEENNLWFPEEDSGEFPEEDTVEFLEEDTEEFLEEGTVKFLEENKAEVERLLKSRSESQEEKTTDDPKV